MMCDLKCTSNSSRQPRWEFLTLHAVYRFPTWGNSTQISVGCWTICPHMNTPWKFNSSPLKMDGWKMSFLLGFPIFRGYVELRGGYINNKSGKGAKVWSLQPSQVDPQKKWPSFLDNYPGKYQTIKQWLVGGFKYVLFSPRNFGEDEPNLTN